MRKSLVFTFLALLLVFAPQTYASQPSPFKVLRVVDGDTIIVDVRGNKERVRLLGIDTPEDVAPDRPVQCFGREAADKLKSFVENRSVLLVDDRTQGNRDDYHRLLRYVYLPDGKRTFVNGEMVKQGYARSFRYYHTLEQEKFNGLEEEARKKRLGMWEKCNSKNSKSKITNSK